MKFLKNENCKLEPVTKYICIFTTVFYSTMLLLVGLLYFSALLPLESQVYIEDLEEFDGTYVDVNAPIPDVLYDYTAMAQYMRVNGKEYSQITEEEIESFRIN